MTTGVSSISGLRRPSKFRVPELCGDLDLEALGRSGPLAAGLANVRYWLSYEQASLQPLLLQTPSPLMEIGTAVALQFSEDVSGALTEDALEAARQTWLPDLSDAAAEPVGRVLDIWTRCLEAREQRPRYNQAGFRSVPATSGISLKDLEAIGHADIRVDLEGDGPRLRAALGTMLAARARDTKGRPLPNIEVEHPMGAEILLRKNGETGDTEMVFWIPGPYRIRVPSRATGDRTVVAG